MSPEEVGSIIATSLLNGVVLSERRLTDREAIVFTEEVIDAVERYWKYREPESEEASRG